MFHIFANWKMYLDFDETNILTNQILNEVFEHGYEEKSGKIKLNKGRHSLELKYFQSGGGQELKVFWKGPGFEKRE